MSVFGSGIKVISGRITRELTSSYSIRGSVTSNPPSTPIANCLGFFSGGSEISFCSFCS